MHCTALHCFTTIHSTVKVQLNWVHPLAHQTTVSVGLAEVVVALCPTLGVRASSSRRQQTW